MNLYNIYCDESCHLEHDGINVMVLGAVWCQQTKLKEVNQRIREIKVRNKISPTAEMKWTKISPAMVQLYIDLNLLSAYIYFLRKNGIPSCWNRGSITAYL